MRPILAALLTLALGAPAALALPSVGSGPTVSDAAPIVTVAKKGKAKAKASKKDAGLGGIHPLVGSGGY